MGHMQCETKWSGQGIRFESTIREHKFIMDSRGDGSVKDLGPSPKELLLASICGCSGMDVVSILQKMRIELQSCDVNAHTETTAEYPSVFSEVRLQFRIISPNVKPEQALKAVTLSMTKYCGVSAMIVKVSPIVYEVFVNDVSAGQGRADFSGAQV